MITIYDIFLLVWLHFIADFVLQSDEVAKNKSKSNWVLLKHVSIYGIPFLWFGIMFALINVVLHFITDYITSRWTSTLWEKGKVHNFFVVIGLDQAIHITTLIGTLYLLQEHGT